MNNFIREDRYLVLKRSDIALLSARTRTKLFDIAAEIHSNRLAAHKEPLQAVVIEHDWPQYEAAWKLIEDGEINADKMGPYFAVWQATGKRLAEWHKRCLAEGYAGGVQEVLDIFFSEDKKLVHENVDHFLHAAATGEIETSIGVYGGRRTTPLGTKEFFGFLNDGVDSFPMGTKLYVEPPFIPTLEVGHATKTAWLIEDYNAVPNFLTMREGVFGFTSDVDDALQFCRKADAEKIVGKSPNTWAVREHQWPAPSAQSLPPEQDVMFEAACSNLRYQNPEACGEVAAIWINGKRWAVVQPQAQAREQQRGARFPLTKVIPEIRALIVSDELSKAQALWMLDEIVALRSNIAEPQAQADQRIKIGQHWLEVAFERVTAGEPELDVLKDYGYARETQAQAEPVAKVDAHDYLSALSDFFKSDSLTELWEGPDGCGTHGIDLCFKISNLLESLAHTPMALGLTEIPLFNYPIPAAPAVPKHDDYHQLAFEISTPDEDGNWYRFSPDELDQFVLKLFCRAGSQSINEIAAPHEQKINTQILLAHDQKAENWQDFRNAGLLWWINRSLHLFGWSIFVMVEADGSISQVYPARCTFRGFDRADENEGFRNLTEHLKENAPDLWKDVI